MKWLLVLALVGCGDKVCKNWVNLHDQCEPGGNSAWIDDVCYNADRDKLTPEVRAMFQQAKACMANAADCPSYKKCAEILNRPIGGK